MLLASRGGGPCPRTAGLPELGAGVADPRPPTRMAPLWPVRPGHPSPGNSFNTSVWFKSLDVVPAAQDTPGPLGFGATGWGVLPPQGLWDPRLQGRAGWAGGRRVLSPQLPLGRGGVPGPCRLPVPPVAQGLRGPLPSSLPAPGPENGSDVSMAPDEHWSQAPGSLLPGSPLELQAQENEVARVPGSEF